MTGADFLPAPPPDSAPMQHAAVAASASGGEYFAVLLKANSVPISCSRGIVLFNASRCSGLQRGRGMMCNRRIGVSTSSNFSAWREPNFFAANLTIETTENEKEC